MNPMELRQAKRMLRNAKEAERNLFQLIGLLRDSLEEKAIDWEAVVRTGERTCEYLNVVYALLDATHQELNGGAEIFVFEPGLDGK